MSPPAAQPFRWRSVAVAALLPTVLFFTACMAYGLLASGRTDIALDTEFKVHDFAPFVPIVEGAGGVITDWAGRPLTLQSGPQVLAAGDPARHAEALRLVEAAVRM